MINAMGSREMKGRKTAGPRLPQQFMSGYFVYCLNTVLKKNWESDEIKSGILPQDLGLILRVFFFFFEEKSLIYIEKYWMWN